jgi:N-acyl-D-amino-acid deacylase
VLDVILTGGTIVDGVGTPAYATDLGIKSDVIARIGDCAELQAPIRINCSGLAIAPGFIDMHGHSDEILLVNPLAESKVRQGVTTEVGGNCGASPGPLSDDALAERNQRFREHYGSELATRTMGSFFDLLEHTGPALNFCCLVGLGETRAAVGGLDARPLEKEDLERQCRLVREACGEGAIGVSSGLIYPPGSYAHLDELTALAAAARSAGSPLYASHIRSEGDALLEAVDEALDVGKRADVGVQLSHHKAAGKRNWGKVHDTLAKVERARRSGLDVVLDQYPYKASSTGLAVILPNDVQEGGKAATLARLRDRRYAALVAARIALEYRDRWNNVLIASVNTERNKGFEGMTIQQIATETERAPVAVALDLLVAEELDVGAIYFTMCEDDVRTVLSYGQTTIGSDASARSHAGLTARGKPHPRAFGTFPRVLGRYVRDTGLLSLEEAVRRATSLPAHRLGLRNRGTLAEGRYADIVVFDPKSVVDTATYEDPYQYPRGIVHVFVNGAAVVSGERTTGVRSGRVLRRGRDL